MICTSAIAGAVPVHIKKDNEALEIAGLYELNVKDITLETPFAGCINRDKCVVSELVIEGQESSILIIQDKF